MGRPAPCPNVVFWGTLSASNRAVLAGPKILNPNPGRVLGGFGANVEGLGLGFSGFFGV